MKEIMNKEQISRTLKRMAHEIIERNSQLAEVVLVGILNKGLPLAHILKDNLKRFADIDVPCYGLSINAYRDDDKKEKNNQNNHFDVTDKHIILIDDVLYTGRTIRAALDALTALGRPKQVQLAILIDRGHREIPIRADYIGKNIPTSKDEKIVVDLEAGVTLT